MSIASVSGSQGETTRFEDLLRTATSGSAFSRDYLLAELRDYLLRIANEEIPLTVRAEQNPSDLVQQSLLIAHGKLEGFRGKTERELRHWARAILRNQILDTCRRVSRRPDLAFNRRVPLEDFQTQSDRTRIDRRMGDAVDEAVRREEDRVLQAAIERLPERYRQAIALRQEERSFSEIAAALSCSRSGAQKIWARAVELLAERLDSERS